MKLKLICGFQLKDKRLKSLEQEWLKRLRRPYVLEIIEVKMQQNNSSNDDKIVPAKKLISKCSPNAYKILLAEDGDQLSSSDFSKHLQSLQMEAISELNLVIGGPYGVDKSLYADFDQRLSISCMTLTSELCRVVLVEQIYRAQTISQGVPYHKE